MKQIVENMLKDCEIVTFVDDDCREEYMADELDKLYKNVLTENGLESYKELDIDSLLSTRNRKNEKKATKLLINAINNNSYECKIEKPFAIIQQVRYICSRTCYVLIHNLVSDYTEISSPNTWFNDFDDEDDD